MAKRIAAVDISVGTNPYNPVYAHIVHNGNRDFLTAYENNEILIRDPQNAFEADQGYQYLSGCGYEMIPLVSAFGRGHLTYDTFQELFQPVVEGLKKILPVDGVYLTLSGSLSVDGLNSGDNEVVSTIRDYVGMTVPVISASDYHCGMSAGILKIINGICTFRNNPHTDVQDTKIRAAKLLDQSISGGILPHNIIVSIPMIVPDSMTQAEGAGAKVNAYLAELENMDGVLSASLLTGSAWSNHPTTGSYLVATVCKDDLGGIKRTLLNMAEKIFAVRDQYKPITKNIRPQEAFAAADAAPEGTVFLNDSGDNPTNASVGDSAYMLDLALKSNQTSTLIAGIWDDAYVDKCISAGIGNCVSGKIGASILHSGSSAYLEGIVCGYRKNSAGAITGAKVKAGGIMVLVTKGKPLAMSRQFVEAFGESCTDYRKVVLKLGYLLDDFLPMASDCYMVLTPGCVDADLARVGVRMDNVLHDVYPFKEQVDFKPVVIE